MLAGLKVFNATQGPWAWLLQLWVDGGVNGYFALTSGATTTYYWDRAYGTGGTVSGATSTVDSYSRPYAETGGYRYTRSYAKADATYHKICQTPAGVEPSGETA